MKRSYFCITVTINERKQTLLAEIGNFLIDIAKLVFGGVILAGIMEYETINQTILFIIGGVVVLSCFCVGLAFTVYSKPQKK